MSSISPESLSFSWFIVSYKLSIWSAMNICRLAELTEQLVGLRIGIILVNRVDDCGLISAVWTQLRACRAVYEKKQET